MVNVYKDNRNWRVKIEFKNKDCPFLYYPLNYHGCELLKATEGDWCCLENCPHKIEFSLADIRPTEPMEDGCSYNELKTTEKEIDSIEEKIKAFDSTREG